MTQKQYDALIFIGRFQPFHNGHQHIVEAALELTDKVIICVGSAEAPRTPRNPFNFSERYAMIHSTMKHDSRIEIIPINDYWYNNDKWVAGVQDAVAPIFNRMPWSDYPKRIALIGHSKDHTSYYLKMFPQWKEVEVDNHANIDATRIRNNYFQGGTGGNESMINAALLSPETTSFMEYFRDSQAYDIVKEDFDMVQKYKAAWSRAPYAPTFITTDTVVTQSGHVLLVKRGASPGKGQWALPGGFLDQDETLLECAIRELKEETKIKVPVPVLKGNIVKQHTFDDPHRSSRGRTVTTAFHIALPDDVTLPKVKGSDDAVKAKWIPFNEVDRSNMFEDHAGIIDYFLDVL